jgi:hypothetical protein
MDFPRPTLDEALEAAYSADDAACVRWFFRNMRESRNTFYKDLCGQINLWLGSSDYNPLTPKQLSYIRAAYLKAFGHLPSSQPSPESVAPAPAPAMALPVPPAPRSPQPEGQDLRGEVDKLRRIVIALARRVEQLEQERLGAAI